MALSFSTPYRAMKSSRKELDREKERKRVVERGQSQRRVGGCQRQTEEKRKEERNTEGGRETHSEWLGVGGLKEKQEGYAVKLVNISVWNTGLHTGNLWLSRPAPWQSPL